jgi:bifunctional ADP-heptose synthase (sugar kinase/adenylyltransferase)
MHPDGSAHLLEMLPLIANRRVLVIGDLMLDEWIWGRVSRISPEAPIPVVDVESISRTPRTRPAST